MRLNKVKKLYPQDFLKKIENSIGKQFREDFEKTYYWSEIRNIIFDKNFYVQDFNDKKPKLRITFPLFLICLLVFHILGAIKWLFVGTYTYNENNYFVKKMIAWDKYCRFNIVS